MRKRARQRLARPSMFMVPMKLVLMVLMGLYLLRVGQYSTVKRQTRDLARAAGMFSSAAAGQHCNS